MAKRQTHKNVYKKRSSQKRYRIRTFCVFVSKGVLVFACVAILSFAMIFIHDLVTQSACFEVRTISVEGCRRVSAPEVRQWAGLDQKTNILSVSIKAMQRRLTAHPWIDSADIRREVPHTLHIRVSEHRAVAIVDCGPRFLLDDRGRVFKKVDHGEELHLPTVTGLGMSDLEVDGNDVSPLLETVLAVARLAGAEGSVLPLDSVTAIHVDKEIGLTLYAFDNDTEIKLGFRDYGEKFDRLREIVPYLRAQQGLLQIECVDLKDTGRVVVKERDFDSKEV